MTTLIYQYDEDGFRIPHPVHKALAVKLASMNFEDLKKQFDELVEAIASEVGNPDEVSTVVFMAADIAHGIVDEQRSRMLYAKADTLSRAKLARDLNCEELKWLGKPN